MTVGAVLMELRTDLDLPALRSNRTRWAGRNAGLVNTGVAGRLALDGFEWRQLLCGQQDSS